MTYEQLKSYRSARQDSLCPGSTQIQQDGIEVSTGALGQGVANAVGLAAAAKHLGATYDRPGHQLISNMTWCTVGDACLQEGVALEAIQLAGHWKLDNLAIIYDNNQVTCCGPLNVTCSEDINAKMTACGWKVIDVFDGVLNVEGIVQALVDACNHQGKPVFINVRTIIAFGSTSQGQAKTHGDALGAEDVASIKRQFGMDPDEQFRIDADVYEFFGAAISRGRHHEAEFERKLDSYAQEYPELAGEFQLRMEGRMTDNWQNYVPQKENLSKDKLPSRISAAHICGTLARNLGNLMVCTADLRPAVNMSWDGHMVFQHPETENGLSGSYSGRYMHCGIREHAMVSIASGLAAYNHGTILPITSGFFMFYIYAAAGVRMGALQGLQTIHIATHDSIAIGEDGPTHQPIALPALFRAMPNLLYIRPCDGEETCGAFMAALDYKSTPSMISLSRHALTQYPQYSSRVGVTRGAYVFVEREDADVTLVSTGSEMVFALGAKDRLDEVGIAARIVSFPCQRLFEMQTREYRESVMQYLKRKLIVAIEVYAVNGWERYADAGYTLRTFGKSLPAETGIYKFFNFESEKIAAAIEALVAEVGRDGVESLRGNFRDLNGGPMGIGLNPYP